MIEAIILEACLALGIVYSSFRMHEMNALGFISTTPIRIAYSVEIAMFLVLLVLMVTGWFQLGWLTWIWFIHSALIFVLRTVIVNIKRWDAYLTPGESSMTFQGMPVYRSVVEMAGVTAQEIAISIGLVLTYLKFIWGVSVF